MKKRLICAALATSLPVTVMAGPAEVSGFADITYENDNDLSLFRANAEVDVNGKLDPSVAVRIDADLALAAGTEGANAGVSGPADSAVIEQAYFAWSAPASLTVLGGVFNNPIGWEKEDAPDMYSISKGQIYEIFDGQTALYGNNIAGVAVAGKAGPLGITAGVLNELGHNDLTKNSYALVANLAATKGVDIELGYVTQEGGAGDVLDANATLDLVDGLTIGLEYLQADAAVDSAMGMTISYVHSSGIGAALRYDTVSYEDPDTDDSTRSMLVLTYSLAKNLDVLAEYKSDDDGTDTNKAGMLEFIAKF